MFKRRKLIIVAGIVIVLVGAANAYWFFVGSKNTGPTKVSDNTANAISEGKCDDNVLAEMEEVARNTNSAEDYEKLASCYLYREDFQNALANMRRANELYSNTENSQKADETSLSIESIEQVIEQQTQPAGEEEEDAI